MVPFLTKRVLMVPLGATYFFFFECNQNSIGLTTFCRWIDQMEWEIPLKIAALALQLKTEVLKN